jgi:hypothetical protein
MNPIKNMRRGKQIPLGWRFSDRDSQAHYWRRSDHGWLAHANCGKLADFVTLGEADLGMRCDLCERINLKTVEGYIHDHTQTH